MKPLEQMTIGQRIVLTFVIVLVILFALAFIGWISGGWDVQAEGPPRHTSSKYDDRLLELDKEAIETAYRTQIEHLFEVWMKSAEGQPARAVTGANNARKAFIGAMDTIEREQQRLRGNP